MTTESRDPSSNLYSDSESCSEFKCDDCSLSEASSDLENTSVELYSKELNVVSFRVQEHW